MPYSVCKIKKCKHLDCWQYCFSLLCNDNFTTHSTLHNIWIKKPVRRLKTQTITVTWAHIRSCQNSDLPCVFWQSWMEPLRRNLGRNCSHFTDVMEMNLCECLVLSYSSSVTNVLLNCEHTVHGFKTFTILTRNIFFILCCKHWGHVKAPERSCWLTFCVLLWQKSKTEERKTSSLCIWRWVKGHVRGWRVQVSESRKTFQTSSLFWPHRHPPWRLFIPHTSCVCVCVCVCCSLCVCLCVCACLTIFISLFMCLWTHCSVSVPSLLQF